MAGIVFAKFTKPANRAETILFSKNALISMRNGAFYLLCRIGDLRYAYREFRVTWNLQIKAGGNKAQQLDNQPV